MAHDNIIRLIVIFIIISLLIGFTSTLLQAQASNAMIEIDSAAGTVADEFDVSIYINPTERDQVGAFTTRVAYDETIVEVLSCTPINFTGVCNIDSVGTVKLAGFHTIGVQEKTEIATVKLKALSSTQDAMLLVPTISLLGNARGEKLTNHGATAGQVNIHAKSFDIYLPIMRAP